MEKDSPSPDPASPSPSDKETTPLTSRRGSGSPSSTGSGTDRIRKTRKASSSKTLRASFSFENIHVAPASPSSSSSASSPAPRAPTIGTKGSSKSSNELGSSSPSGEDIVPKRLKFSTLWRRKSSMPAKPSEALFDEKKYTSLPKMKKFDKDEHRRTSFSAPGSPASPDGIDAATRLLSLFDPKGDSASQGIKREDSEASLDVTEEKKFFVKVECIEVVDGEKIKEVKIMEVFPSTPIDEFQKKACKRFCKWEDWRFGLFSEQNNAWMTAGTIGDYNLKPMSILHLKVKSADFFDSVSESTGHSKKTTQINFNLFSRTFMETKKLKKGSSYLSFILFNKKGELLMTPNQLLPSFLICKDEDRVGPLDANSSDFLWIMKQTMDWENPAQSGMASSEAIGDANQNDNMDDASLSNLTGFPKAFVDTVKKARKELSLRNMGHVYEEPLLLSNDISVIVAIAYISQPDAYTELLGKKRISLKWSTASKLDPHTYDLTGGIWENYSLVHDGTRNKLAKGLYVGLFLSENTPKGSNVLVPSVYRQMCPVMKLRDDPEVNPEEWQYLTESCKPSSPKETFEAAAKRLEEGGEMSETISKFHEIFMKSVHRLVKTTGIEFNMSHMYPKQPLQIDDSGTITLIPFVRIYGMEAEPPTINKPLFTLYPLQLFEIIHQHVYKASSFNDFRRRSTMIESTIMKQSLAMRSALNDGNFNSVTSQLRENEQTLRKEKLKWQASSWVFTLLEWHRATAWRSMYQKN